MLYKSLIKGELYMTTDPRVVLQSFKSFEVISIADRDNTIKNTINGGIFIPPCRAVNEYLNGNKIGFNEIYGSYLYSKGPMEFLAVLLKGLVMGKSFLLYITKDEFNEGFFDPLINHFLSFGLFIGNVQHPFKFNINKEYLIVDVLYLNDMFNAKEYLTAMPPKYGLSEPAIRKLTYDIPLDIRGKSAEEISRIYYDYKEKIKHSNKFLTPMFVKD